MVVGLNGLCLVWEDYFLVLPHHSQEIEESVCVWFGRITWLVLPHHSQEEESLPLGMSCQGQGQGGNVLSAIFGGCSGLTLLAQTTLQTFIIGVLVFYVGASALEMEREK